MYYEQSCRIFHVLMYAKYTSTHTKHIKIKHTEYHKPVRPVH